MRTPDSDLYKDKIEISLDGRQVFYLFFGGAVIACLVFVLGVMVGRRVEARAHVDQAAATSTERDPLAALDRLDGADAMSFRSALTGGGASPGDGEAAAAIDRVRDEAAQAAAKADAPDERAKGDAAKQAAKVEPAKPEPARDAKAEPAKVEPAKVEPAKKVAKAEPVRLPDDAAAKPAEERAPDPGRFTLQLSSFQDRTEAQSFLADVRASGYKAYLVEADVEGKGRYYRVRFGSFSDYQAALTAKEQFEAKVNRIAYVTRL